MRAFRFLLALTVLLFTGCRKYDYVESYPGNYNCTVETQAPFNQHTITYEIIKVTQPRGYHKNEIRIGNTDVLVNEDGSFDAGSGGSSSWRGSFGNGSININAGCGIYCSTTYYGNKM